MDPKIVTTLVGIGTFIAGFLLKWALPSVRKVADGELSRAERELQEALAAEKRAHDTPSKDDDKAAEEKAAAAKRVRDKKAQIKEIIDGIPVR